MPSNGHNRRDRTLDCVEGDRRRALKAYLVETEPGVHVVEDYYRPVFFAQDCYWRLADGLWLRSDSWLGPWDTASSRDMPAALQSLANPDRFVLFHAPPSANRHAIAESGA